MNLSDRLKAAAAAQEVAPLVEQIRPLLAGKSPEVQGAVIADLLSIFLTGLHPVLREQQLRLLVDTARRLIPENEKLIFPDGLPEGWGKN